MDRAIEAGSQMREALNNSISDDAIKGLAVANRLADSGSSVEPPNFDDILDTAADLLLPNMLGIVQASRSINPGVLGFEVRANELEPVAKAVLEIKRIVEQAKGIEDFPEPEIPVAVDLLLPPHVLPKEAELGFAAVDLRSAVTFEEVVAAVAYDLHKQAQSRSSSEADQIARELVNLSKAAREGNREQLLQSSKAIAAHIQAFCSQIVQLAKSLPCQTEREKIRQNELLKSAQVLRNYATQLKILASVKATTIEESKDTDQALSTLARNLGALLSSSMQLM